MASISRLVTSIVLAFSFILMLSCEAEGASQAIQKEEEGELIFKTKCSVCHGLTGDKQLSGAKKLTESSLSQEEIESMVTNGQRQMPAFNTQLTKEEIQAVSKYAFTFRTK